MRQWWKNKLKGLPFDSITTDMLRNLDYGEDLVIGKNWVLSKHSEDDCIDIRLNWDQDETEACGEYLYSVMWDHETHANDSIEYEQCFDENVTPMEESERFKAVMYLSKLGITLKHPTDKYNRATLQQYRDKMEELGVKYVKCEYINEHNNNKKFYEYEWVKQ